VAPLGAGELGQGIEGGAGIGMLIKALSAGRPDAPPPPYQQRAPKQIGPNLQPIETALILLRLNAGEGDSLREERKLNRHENPRALGRDLATTISSSASTGQPAQVRKEENYFL
jgi:hypothetical protein